jgi:undecaprenyl-diphosphatase
MTLFSGLVLGLVEGFTEFIPVSSTGHLILVRDLLGLQVTSGLAVDAVLNMAAVAAILVYFFKDIVGIVQGSISGDVTQRRLLLALILGTIPAIGVGLLFQDVIETTFRSSLYVAVGLVLEASLLFQKVSRSAAFKRWRFCPA